MVMKTAPRDTTLVNQDARDVATLLGHSSDVLAAMTQAERYGSARVGSVILVHTGYLRGATEFHAGTALYRLPL